MLWWPGIVMARCVVARSCGGRVLWWPGGVNQTNELTAARFARNGKTNSLLMLKAGPGAFSLTAKLGSKSSGHRTPA